MNKKIGIELAVGIILLIAIVLGGFIWLGNRKSPTEDAIKNKNLYLREPAVFKLGNTKIVKTQTINSDGGEIKIENSQTPLDGFVIAFPSGVFEQASEVSIGYNDGVFENLPSGKPTGKTIEIKVVGLGVKNLKSPISISFSSDSRQVTGFAIDSKGHLSSIDTIAFNPLVKSYTFNYETIITWVYIDK